LHRVGYIPAPLRPNSWETQTRKGNLNMLAAILGSEDALLAADGSIALIVAAIVVVVVILEILLNFLQRGEVYDLSKDFIIPKVVPELVNLLLQLLISTIQLNLILVHHLPQRHIQLLQISNHVNRSLTNKTPH